MIVQPSLENMTELTHSVWPFNVRSHCKQQHTKLNSPTTRFTSTHLAVIGTPNLHTLVLAAGGDQSAVT